MKKLQELSYRKSMLNYGSLTDNLARRIKAFNRAVEQGDARVMGKKFDAIVRQLAALNPDRMPKDIASWWKQNQKAVEAMKAPVLAQQLQIDLDAIALYYTYSLNSDHDIALQKINEQINASYKPKKKYDVKLIGGKNNPVFLVENLTTGAKNIVRFLQVSQAAQKNQNSCIQAIERLQKANDPAISKQYHRAYADVSSLMDDYFIEISECLEHGNLEEAINSKYPPITEKEMRRGITDLKGKTINRQKDVLAYAKALINMHHRMEQRGVYYTDIKPSNLMIGSNNKPPSHVDIVYSDAKSFLLSSDGKWHDFRDSPQVTDAFVNTSLMSPPLGEAFDLKRISRQALASSIYQMVTGEQPTKDRSNTGDVIYDFQHYAFTGPEGEALKSTIENLIADPAPAYDSVLKLADPTLTSSQRYAQQLAQKVADARGNKPTIGDRPQRRNAKPGD